MIFNLLADENGPSLNTILTWVLVGVLIVLVVVWFVFSGRKNKQRQKEYVEQLDAIRPGHKVKTAGGICGIVVEVCDDNTVIIETGSETAGKSYVKMDKELIAQTDAKGPTQIAREEAEARRKAERAARQAKPDGQAPADDTTDTPAEAADVPADDTVETVDTPDTVDTDPAEETEVPDDGEQKNG